MSVFASAGQKQGMLEDLAVKSRNAAANAAERDFNARVVGTIKSLLHDVADGVNVSVRVTAKNSAGAFSLQLFVAANGQPLFESSAPLQMGEVYPSKSGSAVQSPSAAPIIDRDPVVVADEADAVKDEPKGIGAFLGEK